MIELKTNKGNFAFVNCHLSYSGSKDKLCKRQMEFMNHVKHFNLKQKYNNGHYVFLCGDLNFRNRIDSGEKKTLSLSGALMEINNILKVYTDHNVVELNRLNELYHFLILKTGQNPASKNKFIIDAYEHGKCVPTKDNGIEFYKQFVKSIYNIVPTCRYKEGKQQQKLQTSNKETYDKSNDKMIYRW